MAVRSSTGHATIHNNKSNKRLHNFICHPVTLVRNCSDNCGGTHRVTIVTWWQSPSFSWLFTALLSTSRYPHHAHIIRLHCLHAVHKCGLLLVIAHIAWSVCLSVFVEHKGELCKNGRTDRDTVWGMTHMGPRNHALERGQDWMNLFGVMRGDKSVMHHFAKSLRSLVIATSTL